MLHFKKKFKSTKGITLVELIITILILSVIIPALMAAIISAFNHFNENSRIAHNSAGDALIKRAIEEELIYARYPKISTDNTEIQYDSYIYGSDCIIKILTSTDGTLDQEEIGLPSIIYKKDTVSVINPMYYREQINAQNREITIKFIKIDGDKLTYQINQKTYTLRFLNWEESA